MAQAHDTQLARIVMPKRMRAASAAFPYPMRGALDGASRGRSTAALGGSMTCDATLKTLADAIEAVSSRYAERFGIRRDIEWCLLKLSEELGELTQAHLKRIGQGRVDGDAAESTRRFEDEMADVLGQVLVLAKLSGADLDAALDRKWLRWHPSRISAAAYFAGSPDDSGASP